jgi:hypothetical protein
MCCAILTSPSVERVRAALARAGLSAEIVEEVGQIANSLVFRGHASDGPLLVMSCGQEVALG